MSRTAEISERVAGQMIEQLQAGVVPWRQPWVHGLPMRMSKGTARPTPYRGSNIFVLGLTAIIRGYDTPWWGTYDCIARLCGMVEVRFGKRKRWLSPAADGCDDCAGRGYACREHARPLGVRKGERGTWVIYWDRIPKPDPDDPDKVRMITILKDHYVFNAAQAEGLPDRYYAAPAAGELGEVPEAELVIKDYLGREGSPSLHWGDPLGAYYEAATDEIHLPPRDAFTSLAGLYGTQFHEMTHSTGHGRRLARAGVTGFDHFGSGRYGREELVAQMGASILNAMTGTDQEFGNSAAYIAAWIRAIKGEPAMVVRAAQQASKAVDFILGVTYGDREDES